MNDVVERLTSSIATATAPSSMDAEQALETMEEIASWLEGSIEALRWEIEEWKAGDRPEP